MQMFYVYELMCWEWTPKHIFDEMFVLSKSLEAHEYLMFFVEREAIQHMSI